MIHILYQIQGQEDSMYLEIYIDIQITVFLGPQGPHGIPLLALPAFQLLEYQWREPPSVYD